LADIRALNQFQLDAIKEVGNVGAGHAATALSQMIEKKILITVPKVLCMPIEKTSDLVGGPQALVAGVTMQILGDLSAKIVLMFSRESALQLAGLLTRQETQTSQVVSDMEHSAIMEAGNILSGAYLNALNEFLGLMLLQSVPHLVFDMADAVVAEISKGLPPHTEIICIGTQFREAENIMQGFFLLIPDQASLDVIIRATAIKS